MSHVLRAILVALVVVGLLLPSTAGGRVNIVLLGSTGNLAEKYLWQSLYNIHTDGLSTEDAMFVYPAATKDAEKSTPILERILEEAITPTSQESKKEFLARVASYVQLRREDQYKELGEQMARDAAASGEIEAGRLFYLSVPPKFFGSIAENINKHLRPQTEGAWLRVIVEKPFGVDSESAEKLANSLYDSLGKHEILLVDHYMGKAGLHGIREFLQKNPLVNYANGRDIKQIEIGMLETEDCKGRTGFYDEVGVIRDTIQNHLMMMLALVGLDGTDPSIEEAERRKHVIEKLNTATYRRLVHLGQYSSYQEHINEDRAKWGEPPAEGKSVTPTYAHILMKLRGLNNHLDGVPIHLKSGKALDLRRSYVELLFDDGEILVFNVQGPTPFGLSGTMIGASRRLAEFVPPENWNLQNLENFGHVAVAPETPSAYESLLRGGLEGDNKNFVRLDEVLEAWRVWTPLIKQVEERHAKVMQVFELYPKGADFYKSDGKERRRHNRHDEL